jgi:hypothetical protein
MSGNNKVARKSSKKKIDHDNIIDLKRQVREEIAREDKANLITIIRNEMILKERIGIIPLFSR